MFLKTKTKNIKLGFLKENCVRIFWKILYLKPSQAEEYSVTYFVFFPLTFVALQHFLIHIQTKLEVINTFYSSLVKNELSENCDYLFGQHEQWGARLELFIVPSFYSDWNTNGEIEVFLIIKGSYQLVKKHRVYRIVPKFLTFPALESPISQ